MNVHPECKECTRIATDIWKLIGDDVISAARSGEGSMRILHPDTARLLDEFEAHIGAANACQEFDEGTLS